MVRLVTRDYFSTRNSNLFIINVNQDDDSNSTIFHLQMKMGRWIQNPTDPTNHNEWCAGSRSIPWAWDRRRRRRRWGASCGRTTSAWSRGAARASDKSWGRGGMTCGTTSGREWSPSRASLKKRMKEKIQWIDVIRCLHFLVKETHNIRYTYIFCDTSETKLCTPHLHSFSSI